MVRFVGSLLIIVYIFLTGCGVANISVVNISQLKENKIQPSYALQGHERVFDLTYTFSHSGLAEACEIKKITNATISTPCSCDVIGVCTTGIVSDNVGVAEVVYEISSSTTPIKYSAKAILDVLAPVPFVSKWRTNGNNETITLPLKSGYNYNFTVEWGDGKPIDTITSYNDAAVTHSYDTSGDYIITITGLVEAWSFKASSSSKRNKIIEVIEFGTSRFFNLDSAFFGCTKLTSFSGGNTEGVTDMTSMFQDTYELTSIDLSKFNTSSVVSMRSMFKNSEIINLDLSNFDTSSVTNMNDMFSGAMSLTTLDVSNFDTSSVTNMKEMFAATTNLETLELSSFDTSEVTNMDFMFTMAMSLTTLDLSNFNTAKVTSMYSMFDETSSLTSLNVSTFDTSAVTSMTHMFSNMTSITRLDLSSFVTTNVNTMNQMFRDSSSLTSINLSNFDTSNVTIFYSMFNGASGLTSLDISHFNTDSATDMSSMFKGASSLTSLDLSGFNTANVTNMYGMFDGTTTMTSLSLNNWNIGNVSNSTNIFSNTHVGLQVLCDQGGSPGTGAIFLKSCN